MKKQISRNITWLFLYKIFRVLGSLLIGVWVARYLGPERFGVLNYALAFVAFFAFLPDLGLSQIIVRELKKDHEKRDVLLGTAFFLKIIGACLALLFVMAAIYITGPVETADYYIILIIASGFIFQAMDVVDYYYQSLILSRYVVIARSLAYAMTSVFKIYLIVNEFGVIWFAFAITLDLLLASVFLALSYRNSGNSISTWGFNRKLAFQLLQYSWPLMLSVFLISVHMRVDQIMLGHMLDNNAVGVYSVAVKLSELWYFIPALIVSTMMPYFIGLRENNNKLYNDQLNQLYSVMFWVGTGVGTAVLFGGESLVVFVFGVEYAGSYEALVYNIWAGIFVAQALARGIWLVSENLQKYRLFNNLLAVAVNITGNMLLVPKYGVGGAAMATLITQFLGTWVFGLIWKPMRVSTINLIKSINPLVMLRLGSARK